MMADTLARVHPTAPLRRFSICQIESGDWIARERLGVLERSFPNRRAALHFVLFELGARAPAALLTPEAGKVAGDRG